MWRDSGLDLLRKYFSSVSTFLETLRERASFNVNNTIRIATLLAIYRRRHVMERQYVQAKGG